MTERTRAATVGSRLTSDGTDGATRDAAAGCGQRRTKPTSAGARGRIYLNRRSTAPVVGPPNLMRNNTWHHSRGLGCSFWD
jgi:hypothetical protein